SVITASGTASMTIKNYNGIEDFKFQDVIISTSVGTGLGALAEEINRNADKTGVRATFNVQTVGAMAIQAGTTTENFSINGVIIGKVDYSKNDENGALVSAINAVKDTTGVQASKDENGRLVLTSADGRGIKVDGIGGGAGIVQTENYGRLSLVKNDGRDIDVSGTGFGFGANDIVSQSSVSLRESKGQINAAVADAMGFNAYAGGGGKQVIVGFSSVSAYMSTAGSGFSAGSGYSVGSGKEYSAILSQGTIFISTMSVASKAYVTSAGSGFSAGSGNSAFASIRASSLSSFNQTAGVTTLKGAMAVMDIAETAITNLDQIRADIGSVQNQVTSTINNITVTQVNVKSAESQIRDVDFASESANYSKANILAQSGSYAMAQANSSQQNVLRLLQ
ncbi:TPA: flagellin, partial [Campylobacter coli]|nr:flagellin [Campylobacter coli]